MCLLLGFLDGGAWFRLGYFVFWGPQRGFSVNQVKHRCQLYRDRRIYAPIPTHRH